mmetsp:Transcript_1421/g.3425  ORF Transcript_1421/g.3425 Transcript_1421/m.3425 type:complete len:466 (-) Transcript_1421:449-1846(-)
MNARMDILVATTARQAEAWSERGALVDELQAAVQAELRRMRVDLRGLKDKMRAVRLKEPCMTARNRSSGFEEGWREAKNQGAPKQASGFVFVSDACCQTSTQDVGLQVHAHSIPSHQESYFPSQQAAKGAVAQPSQTLPPPLPQTAPSTPYPTIDRMLLRKHRLLEIATARQAGRPALGSSSGAVQPAVHGGKQEQRFACPGMVHTQVAESEGFAGCAGAARPPSFDPAPGATCAQFQPVHDQGQERDHGRHCCFSTLGRAESNTNRPVSDAVPEQEVRQTHEAVMCVHAVVGRPKGSMQQHQVCRQQGRARPALVWHPGAQLAGSTQQAHAYAALATWREQRTAAAMLIQAAVRGHLCRLRIREEALVRDAAAALGLSLARRCLSGWLRVATVRKRLASHLGSGLGRRGFHGKQILKEDGKYAYAAAWCSHKRLVEAFKALILSAVDLREGSSCSDEVHGSCAI